MRTYSNRNCTSIYYYYPFHSNGRPHDLNPYWRVKFIHEYRSEEKSQRSIICNCSINAGLRSTTTRIMNRRIVGGLVLEFHNNKNRALRLVFNGYNRKSQMYKMHLQYCDKNDFVCVILFSTQI